MDLSKFVWTVILGLQMEMQVCFNQFLIIKILNQIMTSKTCLKDAILKLQNIFPATNLLMCLRTDLTLDDNIEIMMRQLKVPQKGDSNSTIASMKNIADQQEYRYQRSILEQQKINMNQDMLMFDEQFCFEQGSTRNHTYYKSSKQIHSRSAMPHSHDDLQDIWEWREDQEIEQAKQQYFAYLN